MERVRAAASEPPAHLWTSTAAPDPSRVASYVRLNVLAVAGSVGWLLLLDVFFLHSGWLLVVAVLLVVLCAWLLRAEVLLRVDRHGAAIATFALSNWVAEIVITGLIPYAFVILPVQILLPTLLAVPHLTSRQLRAMFGCTVLVEIVVAVLGRFSAGVGLDASAPSWVLDGTAIVFIPISAGMALALAWQNYTELAGSGDELARSRGRLASVADRERLRIERALQTGPLLRVGSAVNQVRKTRDLVATRDGRVGLALAETAEGLQAACVELREIVHGIYPPQLSDHGLAAALRAAALSSASAVTVTAAEVERYPPEVEAVAYFCCVEAIHRAGQVSAGATVTISLHSDPGLVFDIAHSEETSEPYERPSGEWLTAIADRVGAIGGTVALDRIPGGGFRVQGRLPAVAEAAPGAASWRLRGSRTSAVAAGGFLSVVPARNRIWALGVGTIAVWVCALAATAVSPAVLPAAAVLLLAPVTKAIPQSSRRRFLSMATGTVLATAVLGVIGRVRSATGLGPRTHDAVNGATVVVITLISVLVVLSVMWFNHQALRIRAEELQSSRARLVAAADRERRTVERNLHDGAQQRLVGAAIQARVGERLAAVAPGQLAPFFDALEEELLAAVDELRALAAGLYPTNLAADGLESALRAAADRCSLPTTVLSVGLGRYHPDVELNLYFCCLEALQNATKHAGAAATVTIRLSDSTTDGLRLEVEDSGLGCDPTMLGVGQGWANMSDRLAAIEGTLHIEARPGSGVLVRAALATPRGRS